MRMANVKKQDYQVPTGGRAKERSHFADWNVQWHCCFGTRLSSSLASKTSHFASESAILLLGFYLNEVKTYALTKTYMHVYGDFTHNCEKRDTQMSFTK